MRIHHLEVPLVHRQIDRLADRSAGMVDVRTEIRELDEILEIFERAVAAALVEIVDERRAIVGSEHHRIAAYEHVALGVARMLHILRRRCGAEAPCQAPREPHSFALDIATSVAKQLKRTGKFAKLDANFLKQRLSVTLDRLQPLLAHKFSERDFAGDIGDRGERALGSRASARLAAAARLSGGCRRGVCHGVLAFPKLVLPVRPGACARAAPI